MPSAAKHALLIPSAIGGAVHRGWLIRQLYRLRHGMLERIDGTLALALSVIPWFCLPALQQADVHEGSEGHAREVSWHIARATQDVAEHPCAMARAMDRQP